MKKIALALIALSILASSAAALPRQYGMLARWQQNGFPPSSSPKSRRAVVIYDRELREGSWSLAQTNDVDLFAGAGKFVEVLRSQGIDVNSFDYNIFADSNAMVPMNVAVGQTVTGTGIPGSTTVSYVDPGRAFFEISNAATANNQGATLTIGGVTGGAQWKIVSGTRQVRLMLGSNEAFRRLGDTYSLAIMVGFRALFRSNTAETKFFHPESTNVQMIHVGGQSNLASFDDGSSPVWGSADSTRGNASNVSTTSGRGAAPYSPLGGVQGDTLWGERINFGVAPKVYFSAPPTGFRFIVRLFHPVMSTGNGAASDTALYWGHSFDSTLSVASAGHALTPYRLRYGWWAQSRDSIVRQPYEPLPIAWRVHWTDANGDGRAWVDFVKTHSGANTRYAHGDVILALAARYTDMQPVKIAMEWDDMGNMNPTRGHGSDGITSAMFPTGTRPGNEHLDSLVTEMKDVWGVRLATNVQPDTMAAYIRGEPSDQWENSRVQRTTRHRYYADHKLPWIFHAHDSTSLVGSNFTGKFGGYNPDNGSTVIVGGLIVPASTHRVASATDTTNALALNDPNKYGIVQRLQRSDSLRARVCPQCPLPPYLSFPNNDMLPIDWRLRGSPFPSQNGNGQLPLSSYFNALAQGLGVSPVNGTLYLRGYYYIQNTQVALVPNPAPHTYKGVRYPTFSPVNRWIGYDRDSLAAHTYWLTPDGEYLVPETNLRVRNIGTVPIGNATADMAGAYAKSQLVRNMLLGTASPVVRQSVWANDYSESYTSDANGMLSGSSNVIRNGPGRTPVVYCHPLGGTLAAQGVTEIAQMRAMVLRPLRALSTIAGRNVHVWVYPWETLQ